MAEWNDSINPSTVNTSLQVSPSEVQKPSRYPQKTSLLNTKKNSNNINNKQAPASPEPSSATKRTLADRSPPIFPADLARQPSGKPKVDMDINYITNPPLWANLTSTLDLPPLLNNLSLASLVLWILVFLMVPLIGFSQSWL
ncbi:hypothetical protein G6F32_013315 [Rhizopus arrhizus]|nr:hypothetical protein G6F32_013315 [Rhizopus arrhizus]